MKINENIKAMRKATGLTLRELADRIGVSEATVQRYESGAIENIPYVSIVALSNVFGCSPTTLLGWDSNVEYVGEIQKITADEMELLKAYRDASEERKDSVRILLNIGRR